MGSPLTKEAEIEEQNGVRKTKMFNAGVTRCGGSEGWAGEETSLVIGLGEAVNKQWGVVESGGGTRKEERIWIEIRKRKIISTSPVSLW